jgi:hypothetical protein
MATSAALLALAGTARGQDAAAPAASPASSPEATTLAPVRVKAKAEQETATSAVPGYTARCSATATQTDTPLIGPHVRAHGRDRRHHGYAIERWRCALNVRNLADKTYLGNRGATNCYYGSARTLVGSMTYRY